MKKVITILGAILVASFILNSCGRSSDEKKRGASDEEVSKTSIDSVREKTAKETKQEKSDITIAMTESNISELLQGKWQHIEDETNYLVFEGNHRKEIAEGMDKWDDETFVLSNKCANQSDKDNEIEPEKDKYISCIEADLCWYIMGVDEESLSLSYMGRGNTLTYKRVK